MTSEDHVFLLIRRENAKLTFESFKRCLTTTLHIKKKIHGISVVHLLFKSVKVWYWMLNHKQETHGPHSSNEQQFPVTFYFVTYGFSILNFDHFWDTSIVPWSWVGYNNLESTLFSNIFPFYFYVQLWTTLGRTLLVRGHGFIYSGSIIAMGACIVIPQTIAL